jgi:beta-fructofuranosidase
VRESRAEHGWRDVMTLPYHLSLAQDDSLRIEPVEEVKSLRGSHRHLGPIAVGSGEDIVLDGVGGNAIEIEAVIEPGDAHEVGLRVLRSPGGEEETRISFFPDAIRKFGTPQLQIDGTSSSVRTDLISRTPEIGPLDIAEDEPLRLRIFVDRSIVEVFANGIQALTLRAYPDRDDSTGVSLFARGGEAKLLSLDAWQMECVWPELQGR